MSWYSIAALLMVLYLIVAHSISYFWLRPKLNKGIEEYSKKREHYWPKTQEGWTEEDKTRRDNLLRDLNAEHAKLTEAKRKIGRFFFPFNI